jgi:hypothetical protein
MGKQFDVNGELLPGDATSIQIQSSGLIQGQVTNELTLTTNLDSAEPINAAALPSRRSNNIQLFIFCASF